MNSFFSNNWHRVQHLNVALKGNIRFHRQNYRNKIFHLLHDCGKNKFIKLSEESYFFVSQLSSNATINEAWENTVHSLGDKAPSQNDILSLLSELYEADVLQTQLPPDSEARLFQQRKKDSKQSLAKFLNPLSIKIHLVNPDIFLEKTLFLIRPLLSWIGALVWFSVVIPAIILAVSHWVELTNNFKDQLFSLESAISIWLSFILLKFAHEFGHGYLAKYFGGIVRDTGINLLIFTPIPYVDATSSWSLYSKYERSLVAAGGMIAELFIASIAFFIWLNSEPGMVRAVAFNVFLVGCVTTVFFNANPLVRFDGYYILSDILEIPNLRQRASDYINYLLKRYCIGKNDIAFSQASRAEKNWFISFHLLSLIYRIVIIVSILYWLSDLFLVFTIVIGAFVLIGWAGVPLFKATKYIFTSPEITQQRSRAIIFYTMCFVVPFIFITAISFPSKTMVEGIVWIPESSLVKANANGFISSIVSIPGSDVTTGEILIRTEDNELNRQLAIQYAQQKQLVIKIDREREKDSISTSLLEEELKYTRQEIKELEKLISELIITSQTNGLLTLPNSASMVGRYVNKGDLLGYVLSFDRVLVKTVVPQDSVKQVINNTESVDIRFANQLDKVVRATILNTTPGATRRLPSKALGIDGGGSIVIDPSDNKGTKSLSSIFEIDIELKKQNIAVYGGSRVYIRFNHKDEPLAQQWYRGLRQLFLSKMSDA